MTQPPRIRRHRELHHVGNLTQAPVLPRSLSYEGPGLSVSTCPDAWRQIARLGGHATWSLRRCDGATGRFLDLASLGSAWDAKILEAGLLTSVTQIVVQRYDDEFEEMVEMQCSDIQEALGEAGLDDVSCDSEFGCIAGDPAGSAVFRRTGHTATGALLAWWQGEFAGTPPDCMAREMAVACLVDRTTDLDGVWWECPIDPSRLRAPAGVIVPSRLGQWSAACVGYPDVTLPRLQAS
jgi:hypothetical protein